MCNIKQTEVGVCQQCDDFGLEVIRFDTDDIFRCRDCMATEGLCIECGDYIPFPDEDSDDFDIDFAPSLCDSCLKNKIDDGQKEKS